MEIEHLQRLREANQDLLLRLRMKQEEIRKRLPSKASLDNRTAPESSVPLPTRREYKGVSKLEREADFLLLSEVPYGLFSSQKEAGCITFESDPEEYTIPVSTWSVRPFLGYDWIAGLLDTRPSVAEKSDQYFAELHEFRQVNREECVHEQRPEPRAVDYRDPEQEPDAITSSHKCVYCYRLNQRLFPVPVDSESACPVCKIPRTHRPPETLEEPAYVRVSIPRSTLMPAYKHKAHRRKSFEPEDSLALPSHCLAGWENIISCSNPMLSSLDLRASLEEKPPHHPRLNLVSRVSGGTRTDQLLNLTRLAHFRLSSASQQRGSKPNLATREELQI